jgi:glyoxalase family protein
MSIPVSGLHHVTAIASDPQRNLEFYVGFLGLRLVKRTITSTIQRLSFLRWRQPRHPGSNPELFPWPRSPPQAFHSSRRLQQYLLLPSGKFSKLEP